MSIRPSTLIAQFHSSCLHETAEPTSLTWLNIWHKIMFSSQPHPSCDFCAQLRVSVAKLFLTLFFFSFFFFLKIQAVVLLWHLDPHLVASALCILMRWWHCLKSSSFSLEVAFQPQMNIIWRCCFFPRLAQMERSNGSLPTDSSSATGSMWVPFARFFVFFYTVSLPEFLSLVSEHMHANIWTVLSPNAKSYQSSDNILLGREAPQPVIPAFRTSEQVKVSHMGRQKKKKTTACGWIKRKGQDCNRLPTMRYGSDWFQGLW